ERKVERCTRAFRNENLSVEQCRGNASRLTITDIEETGDLAARQTAPIEHRLEHGRGPRGKAITPDFLLDPDQDAVPQAIRLDQGFHEADLVDAGLKEEAGESG